MLFTTPVELLLRGGPTGDYDDLGNPVFAPDVEEVWPAWYEIMSSEEQVDARDRQEWGYTVYLPAEVTELARALVLTGLTLPKDAEEEAARLLTRPLRSHDAVRIGAEVYDVVGEPGLQPGGFIVPGYMRAVVRKETG